MWFENYYTPKTTPGNIIWKYIQEDSIIKNGVGKSVSVKKIIEYAEKSPDFQFSSSIKPFEDFKPHMADKQFTVEDINEVLDQLKDSKHFNYYQVVEKGEQKLYFLMILLSIFLPIIGY